MNRTNWAVIILVAFMGAAVVYQRIPINPGNLANDARVNTLQNAVVQADTEILNASYRLAYHCKMVVVESLVIAKQSINSVLDTAIDSLN